MRALGPGCIGLYRLDILSGHQRGEDGELDKNCGGTVEVNVKLGVRYLFRVGGPPKARRLRLRCRERRPLRDPGFSENCS